MSKFKTYAHYLEVMKLGKEKWTHEAHTVRGREAVHKFVMGFYLKGEDPRVDGKTTKALLDKYGLETVTGADADLTVAQVFRRELTQICEEAVDYLDNLILTQARLNRSPKEAAEAELYLDVSNPELRTRDIPWAAKVYADCMACDLGFPEWSDEGLAKFLMEQMDADWPDLYTYPPSVTWVKEDRIRSMALKLVAKVEGMSLDTGVKWAIHVERNRIKEIVEAAVAERAAKLKGHAHA